MRVTNKQQRTKTLVGSGRFHPPAARHRWLVLFALALWAGATDAKHATTGFSGLVLLADGGPFTIVRGDTLRSATKGVTLLTGDMLETGPGAFLAIEVLGGSQNLLAIGPSTAVYFLDATTLVVLKGWVKADLKSTPMRVIGTRLGIQGQEAVVLLHADERVDAVYDEHGSAKLLLHDESGTHSVKDTRDSGANQFFRREERTEVVAQPQPSGEFVQQMPVPFRDPLPPPASVKVQPATPSPIRAVTYSDIQAWLTSPHDWRGGFTTRFRSRVKDPAFRAAMDAHLALFPEWQPILHPPPEADRPASQPTSH